MLPLIKTCPLEFIIIDSRTNNKYQNWFYSVINIICKNRNTFTKDFCVINIPKDSFSIEEATSLINILRKTGIDIGLIIRRIDDYTITSEWKKEYILNSYKYTDEEYIYTVENILKIDFFSYLDDESYNKQEIIDEFISFTREIVLTEKITVIINGEIYNILKLIEGADKIIFFDLELFIAEVYYRYGLIDKAIEKLDKILDKQIYNDNKKKIKRIKKLIISKKPKDKFKAIEEFTEQYFEDFEIREKKYNKKRY